MHARVSIRKIFRVRSNQLRAFQPRQLSNVAPLGALFYSFWYFYTNTSLRHWQQTGWCHWLFFLQERLLPIKENQLRKKKYAYSLLVFQSRRKNCEHSLLVSHFCSKENVRCMSGFNFRKQEMHLRKLRKSFFTQECAFSLQDLDLRRKDCGSSTQGFHFRKRENHFSNLPKPFFCRMVPLACLICLNPYCAYYLLLLSLVNRKVANGILKTVKRGKVCTVNKIFKKTFIPWRK